MKKYFWIILAFTVGALIGASIPLKAGEEATQKIAFEHVYPFTNVSGLLGFFDQKDGTIYVYDSNFSQCVSITKLNKLGSPLSTSKLSQSTY